MKLLLWKTPQGKKVKNRPKWLWIFRSMDILNFVFLSNQAFSISFSVLWLLIFCAFHLVNGFSSRFIWKDLFIYYENHLMVLHRRDVKNRKMNLKQRKAKQNQLMLPVCVFFCGGLTLQQPTELHLCPFWGLAQKTLSSLDGSSWWSVSLQDSPALILPRLGLSLKKCLY